MCPIPCEDDARGRVLNTPGHDSQPVPQLIRNRLRFTFTGKDIRGVMNWHALLEVFEPIQHGIEGPAANSRQCQPSFFFTKTHPGASQLI
jgi:hypothetical protein